MKVTDAIFVIADVETTGLEADKGDELVEIAAQFWRYEVGLFGAPFDTLVFPGREIPATASAIHHLTDRDVADAPSIPRALEDLATFAGRESIIVAHNAVFDHAFLPTLHDHRWACSKRLSQHLFPDAPAWNNQVLRYVFDGRDLDLGGLAPHRALADIIVTGFNFRKIIHEYLKAGHPDDVDALIAFSEAPIQFRRIPTGKHRGAAFADLPYTYLQWMLRQDDMDRDLVHSARLALRSKRGAV
jgi:exodeoxyribonuclease X